MDDTLREEEEKEASIMSKFRRTLVSIHDALNLKGVTKPGSEDVSEILELLEKFEDACRVLREVNIKQDKRLASQGLTALQSDMIRQNQLLTNIARLILHCKQEITSLILGRIIDRIDEYIAISDAIYKRSHKIKRAA
jgi:hypothetical protein